jgi:hypothetical protein
VRWFSFIEPCGAPDERKEGSSELTYLSILDEIAIHVQRRSLVQFFASDLRAANQSAYQRSVFVSVEISQERERRRNERSFRLLAVRLEAFVLGRTIPVALEQDHKAAEWARLAPAGWEVWEIRARHVNPELRVLGRFAATDIFIALNLYDARIKGKRNWDAAKLRCQEDWRRLFPQTAPVFGSVINDYISANFTVI